MKYISLIVISSLLCATNSFDMKYSLLKHEWNDLIPGMIVNNVIDRNTIIAFTGNSTKVSLKSTELEGGVTLSNSYILVASFKTEKATSSCLFSMDRKGVQKLALCLEPAGDDAVTITLDSANIPDGKLTFEHKIKQNEWTELILSVNKTHVTQIINCQVIKEKQLNENMNNLVRLTDDMHMTTVTGSFYKIRVDVLDLYSPVDETTLMSLCPNGDIGIEGLIGPPGKGIKGDRGVPGEKGERGEPGYLSTAVSPAATAELDALKSMLSDVKSIFHNYVLEKTEQTKNFMEQTKYFIELNTKCQERVTTAELNIEALKNAMLTEGQL